MGVPEESGILPETQESGIVKDSRETAMPGQKPIDSPSIQTPEKGSILPSGEVSGSKASSLQAGKRKFGQARSPGKFGPGVTKLESTDSMMSLGIPIWRILLAIVMLGGLMWLFFFGLKRFGRRFSGDEKSLSIRIVSRQGLDAKNSLVMVRVYEEDLLLGVGPNGVNLLSRFMSIDGSSAEEDAEEQETVPDDEKLKPAKDLH